MGHVFISYDRRDEDEAAAIANGLEVAGLRTWYYSRDSRPGPSYLRQIADAITGCQAILVIVSRKSIESEQVTSEIIQGFEQKKHFVPILLGLSHNEFQRLQPEWRGAFRAATSIAIPNDGSKAILPTIIEGLKHLGVAPTDSNVMPHEAGSVQAPVHPNSKSTPRTTPPVSFSRAPSPELKVQLAAQFDHASYPSSDDPLVYWIAELRVDTEVGDALENSRPGADIALVLDVSGSMDKPNRYPLLREAVRNLVSGLGPQDRICVTLFTEQSKTVVPFISGDEAAADPDHIVKAMDHSGILFGPNTLLAPGLLLALDAFGPVANSAGRVRRTYVMTDGELYDSDDCKTALYGFRSQIVEVHVYGFGDEFDAAALKRLTSDQIGGTVKPIVNEEDITRTFAHIAAVNRRLVGQCGTMTVTLQPNIVTGDAWVYRPQRRHLAVR